MHRRLQVLDQRLVAGLHDPDLRELLDADLACLLQVEDTLLEPIQRLHRIAVLLCRDDTAFVGTSRAVSGALELDQTSRAKLLAVGFSGLDMRLEHLDRALGLLVQAVEQRDVARERILVSLEVDGDALDLPRHRLEPADEAAQPALVGLNETHEEAAAAQCGGIQPARLLDDVEQQLARVPHLLVTGLRQHLVGKGDDVALGLVAERGELRAVGEIDPRLDRADLVGVDGDDVRLGGLWRHGAPPNALPRERA